MFVVSGAPRSGTTLMQRIINTHPNAACTHEYGIDRLLMKIDSLFDMDETSPFIQNAGGDDKPIDARNLDEFSSRRDREAATIGGDAFLVPRRARDRNKFITSFFTNISGKESLGAIGDKTPNLHTTEEFEKIRKELPDIRFIYMIRNPSNVIVSSMRRAKFTEMGHDKWHIDKVNSAIVEWIDNWEHIARLADKYGDSALIVKYEDLEIDYNKETKRLAEFLGLTDNFSQLSISVPEHMRDFRLDPKDSQEVQRCLGGIINDWHNQDASELINKFPRIISSSIDIDDNILANDRATSRYVLRQGFGAVEDWGTWTHGYRASVRFKLRGLTGRHKVVIELAHINFRQQESFQFFIKPEFDSVIEFSLSAAAFRDVARTSFLCTVVEGLVSFDILIPHPKRPDDLPVHDIRPIGMALQSIRPIMVVE